MTVIASLGAITYLVVGAFAGKLGISPDRQRKFHSSGILLIGWAAVCYGHLVVGG
jgi:hypothetical protein